MVTDKQIKRVRNSSNINTNMNTNTATTHTAIIKKRDEEVDKIYEEVINKDTKINWNEVGVVRNIVLNGKLVDKNNKEEVKKEYIEKEMARKKKITKVIWIIKQLLEKLSVISSEKHMVIKDAKVKCTVFYDENLIYKINEILKIDPLLMRSSPHPEMYEIGYVDRVLETSHIILEVEIVDVVNVVKKKDGDVEGVSDKEKEKEKEQEKERKDLIYIPITAKSTEPFASPS